MHSNSTVPFTKKLRAVRQYLKTKQSVRTVAQKFSVSYSTLYSWIKQYQSKGEDGLRDKITCKRRIPEPHVQEIVMTKESKPFLSISAAQQTLKKKGIKVSQKGIWQIWRRYGLGKRSHEHPLSPFCSPSHESRAALKKVATLLKHRDTKTAARLLNSLPCLPNTKDKEVLKQIPERNLVPRRKLDRIALELGEIPFTESVKKARKVAVLLEKNGYLYSSILANFVELQASAWTGTPAQRLKVLKSLKAKMRGLKDTALWFFYYIEQAMVYSDILEIRKAIALAQKCRKLVHLLPPPDYHAALASLMTWLGRYKDAHMLFSTARNQDQDPISKARLTLLVAYAGHCISGEYAKCRKMLSKALILKNAPAFGASLSIYRAFMAFGEGNLADATSYFNETLKKATKGDLYNLIYGTSVGLAAIAYALNQETEAKNHLKKYFPLIKRVGATQELVTVEQLLGFDKEIPQSLQLMPPMRLLGLLVRASKTEKVSDFRATMLYAERHKLMGLMHRIIVFFPGPVNRMLDSGRKTGLPRAILTLPIFNERTPVYHVKFLGAPVLFKNQQYMRAKLSPKEMSFLIHFALRAGTPGKSILVSDLHRNYWVQSKEPRSLLAHLLVSLRKKIRIPDHLLTVSSAYAEPRLLNQGLYLTTDFVGFETLLMQSQALERADEWRLAKRDCLNAFAMLRGAPFAKMYDPWSEHMRARILTSIEEKGMHIARRCLDTQDVDGARKILEKILSAAPHIDQAKALFEKISK